MPEKKTQDYLASFKARQQDLADSSESIDRKLIELSALFEISQTINSSLNLQSILNNVLLVPMGRMMLAKGLILLKKEGKNNFSVETIKGLPNSLHEKEICLTNMPQHPFLISEIKENYDWLNFFRDFKIELLIPLIARTDILGIICFSKKITGKQFTQDEIEFLTSLSNIATTAIENALVFDEIKNVNRRLDHKIQELNTLFDIGKELNLTLDKDKILKLLSYALMGQVTVNSFIITLKENNDFEKSLVKGAQFTQQKGTLCEDLCKKCSFINTPYLRDDKTEFDNYLSDVGVSVVVPMQVQNETRGYIFLGEKVTKQAYSESDLEFLQTLGNVAIISLENARLFEETLEKQKLEEEMAMASNIQMRLLPKIMPEIPGLEIHGLNVPSKHVGGDYFDIIKINDKNIGVCVADVSGKGMPASLLMSNLQASLHSLVRENYPLDKLVGRINNVIYNNTDPEKYITFFYGLINLENMNFQYVNAGHNPPYILHADKSIEELSTGGIILGMMPDMPYEIGSCQLLKGDFLIMFTDGVTEAMTPDEEEFEEKRVIEFIKKISNHNSVEQINQDLIKELDDFSAGTPQGDDITILSLRITK